MKTPNKEHYLFCKGNTFYFSYNMPPRDSQQNLTYEGYETRAISDEQFGGLTFVKKEGRIGIFLFDSGIDYPPRYLWKSDTFPFIYDEVWMPFYTEHNDVYLAVRVGALWGVIWLYDTQNYHVKFKGWCVPLVHTSRQKATKAIRANYDINGLHWKSTSECDVPANDDFEKYCNPQQQPSLLATPDFISHLEPNEIFVFGSNLTGMHGGGAARIAYEKFGAEWGIGVGPTGQCYAIPTMQGGVETIKPYVEEFIRYAAQHSELTFLVTRIGCGIAGFTDEQIAPLFAVARDLTNVALPEGWR